jgi:hypothetical protein
MHLERPTVTDYGMLRDLTAATATNESEDGVGKLVHTDGSGPLG